MRRAPAVFVVVLSILAALVLARASSAVGPTLVALRNTMISAPGAKVGYVARDDGLSTRLQARVNGNVVRTLVLPGRFGVQLATLDGGLAGITPNGRELVLSDNVNPTGELRSRSRFAVVDTSAMKLMRDIALPGEFSVDTLSPDGRYLYLINHVSDANVTKYQVRAYDLRSGRLLKGTIADKRQSGWVMAGYPVTRAATPDGAWVFTLYRQDNNYPFVHALDTVHHRAVCVGLPAKWNQDGWISTARLELSRGKLEVQTQSGETKFVLDTTTFQLTTV
jgi:DNA-binding beta-propeller fold protein YncE